MHFSQTLSGAPSQQVQRVRHLVLRVRAAQLHCRPLHVVHHQQVPQVPVPHLRTTRIHLLQHARRGAPGSQFNRRYFTFT